MDNIYDIPLTRIDGSQTSLAEYRNKVLLIVNTASHCGFTSQYAGLESLFRKYQDQGLVVLGFPCNQFGAQEPGEESQIASFCESKFDISFPMFSKVEVNGPHAHPLFVALKSKAKGILGSEAIKWNFTKFLVNRDGEVVQRYAPLTKPEDIQAEVAELIRT
jgi:glutathione peroxidase